MSRRPMEIPRATAQRIRLVVFDVDGVMTDGGVYMGATADGTPVELKRFNVQDGLGIRILQKSDVQVALISGRVSEATRGRAAEDSHPAGAAGRQGAGVDRGRRVG